MKFFLMGFQIALTQRLRNVKSWLILLILPLALLAISKAVPSQQVNAPVQVGVVMPEEGGEAFWQLLSARSGTVLTFFQTDEDTLNRNIATGKWDCGLILSQDFHEKIQQSDTKRLFEIRIGEGSAVYPLVRETVASCVVNLVRVPMAKEYLVASKIAAGMEAEEVQSRLEQVLHEQEQVQINMYTPNGDALHPFQLADWGIEQFLRWVLAMALLIWLLLSACDLGRWSMDAGTRRFLPLLPQSIAMLPRLCVDNLLAIVSGCIGMLTIGDGFSGCVAVIIYVMFWSCLGLLITHFPAVWQSIPVIPAFAVVTSLLLSGVQVEVSAFLPTLSNVIQYAPYRLYVQLCQGVYHAMYPLLAASVAAVLLSAICDIVKKR